MEGMKNLSPRRQLEANIAFGWGNIIGFFGGFVSMLIWVIFTKDYKMWWTVVILGIAFCLTIVDLIAKYQQMKALDNMESNLKQMEGMKL
jgi:hypothetical protein